MTEIKRRGRPAKVITNVVDEVILQPDVGETFPNYGIMLQDVVKEFRNKYPDEWELLRLCPLQHGLDDMITRLNNG